MKNKLNKQLQTRMLSVACGAMLLGSASPGLAQNTNPVNTFDSAASTSSFVQWWGTATMTWDSTKDAANDSGSGSVQYSCPFVGAAGEQFMTHFTIANRWGWDDGYVLDATIYTNMSFDIKVDPSSPLTPGGNYGNLENGFTTKGWGTVYLPTYVIPASATNWTHVNRPMNATMTDINKTVGWFLKMWSNGAHTNTLTFNVDNVKFEKPEAPVVIPPPTVALTKAGPAGIQVTMDQNGQQWQRDGISTPAADVDVLWGGKGATPVTYSLTVADYPDMAAHPDFEVHMFIINGDTANAGDQTYGGADWNVPDILTLSIQPNGGPGGDASISLKTNLPNNNPPTDLIHKPATLHSSTMLGTWTLSFVNDTNVTLTAPDSSSTNFVLDPAVVATSFSAANGWIHYGFHKQDGANNGHNDGVSGTISRVKKTGPGFTFDDTFNGAAFNSNYAWRKSSTTAVNLVPVGTAWWVNWTKPYTSFYPQSATSVTGPWVDLAYTSSYATPSKVYAALPGTVGNSYFRMIKRPFTKLQVLMPGETAAPNTPTGKTGTPDAQSVGVPFNVTINACDSVWRVVSTDDTVAVSSTDTTATDGAAVLLPTNVTLAAGTATYTMTFNASGSWTVTATDVTDGTKTPNTGTTTVVP